MARRILAAVASVGLLAAAPVPDPIRETEVAATVRFLCSPELEGRGAADRGGAVAAAFLASRLEALGLRPAGDPGPSGATYFQAVPASSARLDEAGSWIEGSRSGGPPTRFAGGGRAFRVLPDRADTVDREGELVFAGFGIRAPEYGHDDYAGLDVKGSVVIVLAGEPGETDPASRWNGTLPTRHAIVSAKARLAESLGAVALLVVPNPAGRAKSLDELVRGRLEEITRPWLGPANAPPTLPVAYLDTGAAEALSEGFGLRLRSPSPLLEASKPAGRRLAGCRVRLHFAYRDRRELTLRNVIARLGSGAGLDGEIVVLGAHYDHLGMEGGTLYPGADDNASGTAALLAAAAGLAASPPRTGREVVVAFWTGEEEGRIGSAWFVAHPPVPKERIAAAVNLDVLGRANLDKPAYGNVIQLIYSAGAPVLRELAIEADQGIGFDLRFYASLRFQPVSDHYSFFEAGVPLVYPFSGYSADYHRPADTPDKIDFSRVTRSARYVARLAALLAEHPSPIRIDPAVKEAPPPDPFERPEF